MTKDIVIGFVLATAILTGGFFYYFAAGMAPVATADPPMQVYGNNQISCGGGYYNGVAGHTAAVVPRHRGFVN